MQKRLKEKQEAYDAQWDNGKGSHHPDYDPTIPAGIKVRQRKLSQCSLAYADMLDDAGAATTANKSPPHPLQAQADRATEELYNAIVKNDLAAVYDKIAEGADVNFVFGAAYSCPEGYTPLMVACHRYTGYGSLGIEAQSSLQGCGGAPLAAVAAATSLGPTYLPACMHMQGPPGVCQGPAACWC